MLHVAISWIRDFSRSVGVAPIVRTQSLMIATLTIAISSFSQQVEALPKATATPTVFNLTVVPAPQVAKILRQIFPGDPVRVATTVNAVIITAPPDDIIAIRGVIAGIDVKNPLDKQVEAIQLHFLRPDALLPKLIPLFPKAKFTAGPNDVLIVASTADIAAQIRAITTVLDAAPPLPSPKPVLAPTVVHLKQGDPIAVAHAVARSFRGLSVAVSGVNLILRGPPDMVSEAATAAGQLDQPSNSVRFTQVYRLSSVDAGSVAALLSRSFQDVEVNVDHDLNAITILATAHVQQRVADAITQLDVLPGASNGVTSPGSSSQGFGGATSEVVYLHAAVPGPAGASSTSANDIATTVSQAIGQTLPDLKITVPPNSTKLILTGSPHSIEAAKTLISKLDVAEPLVELDTEVYEVDESVEKQLGFKFPTPALSTSYSETTPTSGDGRLLGLQPLTRTPLTLGAQLDFLVSTSKARILEDPRITTFSGKTASLRAGETVNILTTTGGGSGTVATTQVQSFQTGVTLDITPVVNTDDYVTVSLHPSVNSEAGVSAAGVPNIQTRDTTTTVGLHDGQTIVVGGLIEDEDSRSIQKVPFLGDLPLVGRLFQDTAVSHTRNELIVTVTPHILKPALGTGTIGSPVLPIPSPDQLPTIEPTATLPPQRATAPPVPQALMEAPPSPLPSATDGPTPLPSTTPASLPSAFGLTNTYTFGSAPASNVADPGQVPQIFFVQASPTAVRNGQSVTISVITTTNVTTLSLGVTANASQLMLDSVGSGKWQTTFNFNSVALPSTSGNVNEQLTATTALGASTSLRIPFVLLKQ